MMKLVPSGRTIALTAIAAASAATFAVGLTPANAADHRDGPQALASPADDINDVYAFMAGERVVLAMTVFPAADTNSEFSDATVYALHVDRHPAFGMNAAGSSDVLCTFDAEQNIECWIGDEDYVTGDASAEEGLESESGRFRVFAGLRTDPFYFYLAGFNAARNFVVTNFGGLTLFPNGCPDFTADPTLGDALRDFLNTQTQLEDFFGTLNTLAIVIEADADLFVDATNPFFTVYGSTHVKQ